MFLCYNTKEIVAFEQIADMYVVHIAHYECGKITFQQRSLRRCGEFFSAFCSVFYTKMVGIIFQNSSSFTKKREKEHKNEKRASRTRNTHR